MGKTAINLVRDFQGLSQRVPEGRKDPQVIPSSKPKDCEYQIKEDFLHLFSPGQIISESEYTSVKKNYDIRMKYWDGQSQHLGKGVSHISGRKRKLIKHFLEEREYKVKELAYHYHVTGKVAWMAMKTEIQEMKNVKFLYVIVIGESGYDLAAKALKLK